MDEMMKKCPCPPPPPPPPECCHIPVIVERIIKPYFNPDGTPSHRKYYQYPITKLDAVYLSDDIHSPTLDVILEKIKSDMRQFQPILAAGDGNTILTRGKQDGEIGELFKCDYLDEKRRSKAIIPSEYGMYKAFDYMITEAKVYTDKETTRATAVEDSIVEHLHDEVARATTREDEIADSVKSLGDTKIDVSIGGENMLITKNVLLDLSSLSAVKLTTRRVNVKTGEKTNTDQILDITPQLSAFIAADPAVTGKLDASTFDHTSLVTRSEFIIGVGNAIGRYAVTTRDMDTGTDTTKYVSFKSDDINITYNDVSNEEVEIVMSDKFATDDMVQSMLDRVFG